MTRLIVPSIDILDGKAIRLVQGRQGSEKVFGDPVELAAKYDSAGFDILHVVDIVAAFGGRSQFEMLMRMREVCKSMKIQWTGGIRSYDLAKRALEAGSDEVSFGTALFKHPEEVVRCVDSFGKNSVWGSVDLAGSPPRAMIKGWKEGTDIGIPEAIRSAEMCGVGGIILSSVDADGMRNGPDLNIITREARDCGLPIWVAGGMRGPEDARAAFRAGADGVIFGSALYDKSIRLEDLLCLQEG